MNNKNYESILLDLSKRVIWEPIGVLNEETKDLIFIDGFSKNCWDDNIDTSDICSLISFHATGCTEKTWGYDGLGDYYNITDFKPVYFPIESIFEEISIYGETFIPILKFIKESVYYNSLGKIEDMTIVKNSFVNIKIKIGNKYSTYFQARESSIDKDFLDKYMIDYRGMIKKKLAISVFDLEKNPYEQRRNN